MKYLTIIAFLAFSCALGSCLNTLLDDKALEYLANLKYEDAPAEIKALIQKEKDSHKAGDSSHWCCTNDQPVNIVQRTKVEKDVHTVATKVKTGYTSCGFQGWMLCSVYTTKYRQEVFYYVTTYEVPDEQACADHHVKCCKDHILIAENCMDLQTISNNLDLFQALVQLGLLGGIGK